MDKAGIRNNKSKRPSVLLAASEGLRAATDLTSLGWAGFLLADLPKGKGEPILVLPGFGAGDRSTAILRGLLASFGYQPYGWDLGINLGPRWHVLDALERQVEKLYQQHDGHRLRLIGQSLGGIYARSIARDKPDLIESVVTLGSPYGAHDQGESSWAYGAFELAMGYQFKEAVEMESEEMGHPLHVPTTSVYSRMDGVVNWRTCIEPACKERENVEVLASHCGMGVHGPTLRVILDRMAQEQKSWKPFKSPLWQRLMYPSPIDPPKHTSAEYP